MAEVVVWEMRNRALSRSGNRAFRPCLEARSEVEKSVLVVYIKLNYGGIGNNAYLALSLENLV